MFAQTLNTTSKAYNPDLNTDSVAFDPSAAQEAQNSYDNPPQPRQMSERQQFIDALKAHGLDLEVEADLGLIFIKQFNDCTCCHGNVLLCSGP